MITIRSHDKMYKALLSAVEEKHDQAFNRLVRTSELTAKLEDLNELEMLLWTLKEELKHGVQVEII